MTWHSWLGMSLQGFTLLTVLAIAWRASAWKTHVEDRLKALEIAVKSKLKRRWF